eukprot:TRINITY_DN4041_c0_g4_i2.p1 TRINITY_DN4041_c0_g4~~TRINITY_DN4041_c0_g4_i2.p1  ORF type:complete len:179 (+),score=80.54 TRINITY_DN4041_c0_g4_i2:68-604(+)
MEAICNSILIVCRQNVNGITQTSLLEQVKDAAPDKVAEAVNTLLRDAKITITNEGNELVIREANPEEMAKFRGLSNEEMLVYQLVTAESNMGIWIRDLRIRCNLQQVHLNKVLKSLEQRKLIKTVKSIMSKRKLYMKFDIEPSRELTGGAWYHDQEFDYEFINVLTEQIYQYIAKKVF